MNEITSAELSMAKLNFAQAEKHLKSLSKQQAQKTNFSRSKKCKQAELLQVSFRKGKGKTNSVVIGWNK